MKLKIALLKASYCSPRLAWRWVESYTRARLCSLQEKLDPSRAVESSSQQFCFFVHELGFPRAFPRVGSQALWNSSQFHHFSSYCTPANHYFKSLVSADACEKGQCNKDWPGSSKPHTEAPQLQAHFRDPNTADQTKDKPPVPWFLPQLKHTPRRALTHMGLWRCLGCNSIYMNIAMAEAWKGTTTCQTLAELATRKSKASPWRRDFVLVVADSKAALDSLLTKDYHSSLSFNLNSCRDSSLPPAISKSLQHTRLPRQLLQCSIKNITY